MSITLTKDFEGNLVFLHSLNGTETELIKLIEADGSVEIGRIRGLTDVSSLTDAVNREYVDQSIPAGSVMAFATDSPTGRWLVSDGSAVSRTLYSDLFAEIGTTYGEGDGSTTFNIPDYRAEFLRGLDLSRGIDPGRTIGSSQLDQMQRITGYFRNTQLRTAFNSVSGAFSHYSYGSDGLSSGTLAGTRLDFDSGDSPSARVSDTVEGETRSRNVAVVFCIKY